ncbi:MAG TPA: insulinase family protein [Candidatus Eisenbacteria bacterium]|nr:insulinase family protein [Candidatus Eisenbacteria bacterium]
MRPAFLRIATALAVLIAVSAGASRAAAAPQLVRTLPNKATLIVRENRTRPIVSIQAWIQAGTRDESRPERGAASVLAQLGWEGTPTRTKLQIDEAIAMVGGRYQGEVGTGHILFEVDVPAREFEEAATILGDVVAHPIFDAKKVEDAKSLARTASRNTHGHAALAAINPVAAALHPDAPLGAPRAVSEAEIAALTVPLVSRFHQQWFVGGNLLIVVVGDVDPADAERVITQAFSGLPAKGASKRARSKERPLNGAQVIGAFNPVGAGGSAVTVGFRAPAWGTADALAMDALVAMLTDYGDARIQRRLGEGLFFGASAQRSFELDGGTVAFSIAAPPEGMKDAETVLFSEIARARSTPIDPREFQRTIETVIARDMVAQGDFAGEGRVTAIAAMQGTIGADEVYAERLRALKPEDLVAVARQYLDPKQAVVVAMAPKNVVDSLDLFNGLEARAQENLRLATASSEGGGPPPTMSDAAERRRRVDAALASIPKQPRDAGRGFVTRSVLEGGIRLLTSEDRGPALVTVAVYLEGSVRHETEKNNGITRLLREVLLTTPDPKAEGRSYRFSLLDLGRLAPYQDRDLWGYSLTVPSHHWKEAVARLGTMFASPDLDSVTVDATRLLVLDEQTRWLNEDPARRRHLIFKAKYLSSGYRLPLLGSPGSLSSIDGKALEAFYGRFVVKPNLIVAVFGNVNAAEVGPTVAEAFRGVRGGPFDPGPVAKEAPFEGFREKWELGQGTGSTVSIAFNGPAGNSPDVPIMFVINSLYTNPRGWLKTYIQDKAMAVTQLDSYVAHAIDEAPIITTLHVSEVVHEEAATKMLLGQFRSVAGIKLVGTYAPDYEYARKHAVGQFHMSLSTSANRALQFARAEAFRLPPDYIAGFSAKLLAVTPDDIQAAGFSYFQFPDSGKRPYAVCETRPGGW